MIYLDNAATTFPKPEKVWDVMDEMNRTCSINAGRGAYNLANRAASIIDETKGNIAKLVGLQESSKIIFTPSVTIAINQVLNGIEWTPGDIIYVSPYEHNAVARTVNLICKNYGVKMFEIPICANTLEIDIDALRYMFMKNPPKCVCVNAVSNVTGYILPIKEILETAKKYDAITIVDTAQALGLIPINIEELGADFIVFAGHKTLYGPFGIGGFIYNSQYNLKEFIVGGTGSDSLNLCMPSTIPAKYECSSQNIVSIAGLNAALKWRAERRNIEEREHVLTQYTLQQLGKLSGIRLYVPEDQKKHIGIISLNICGYKAEDVGLLLDQDYGIAVRTGYHCAPFIHKWLKDQEYQGTVRISIGYFNTEEDIDIFINALKELIEDI